jgi:hypothetical protein
VGSWRRRGQRGQALTEFLVAAVALIPLFLLMPVIAKYQDISHATQMASRYVALEALTRNDSVSAWKPESQLADEVRRRFFSNADAPIKTLDVAGDFKANQNLFWRDPRDAPLIADFKDVTVSFGAGNGAAHGDAFGAASDGVPFTPLSGQLQLRARGIYTANVSVKIANLPAGLKFYEPFDKLNLSIARKTSVVIDPWTAQSPAQVEGKILASPTIFPSGDLASISSIVGAAITTVDAPGLLAGPLLGQLDFWRDVVPEDRLKSRN